MRSMFDVTDEEEGCTTAAGVGDNSSVVYIMTRGRCFGAPFIVVGGGTRTCAAPTGGGVAPQDDRDKTLWLMIDWKCNMAMSVGTRKLVVVVV